MISTPVTPKPADSWRQEMGKPLPFALPPGLMSTLLLLAQPWAGASTVMGGLCAEERWVWKCGAVKQPSPGASGRILNGSDGGGNKMGGQTWNRWDVAAAKSLQGSWSFSWFDPEPCGVKLVPCPLLCRYR